MAAAQPFAQPLGLRVESRLVRNALAEDLLDDEIHRAQPGQQVAGDRQVGIRHDQRAGLPGQPAIVALPIPKPYGRYGLTKFAVDASLPSAVGAFVAWLLGESGWKVTERERPGETSGEIGNRVCQGFVAGQHPARCSGFEEVPEPRSTKPLRPAPVITLS